MSEAWHFVFWPAPGLPKHEVVTVAIHLIYKYIFCILSSLLIQYYSVSVLLLLWMYDSGECSQYMPHAMCVYILLDTLR